MLSCKRSSNGWLMYVYMRYFMTLYLAWCWTNLHPQFEHCFKQYPNLSLPTRHRAIMLFCRFCSRATAPNQTEETKVRAHKTGVACLTLACKIDIDSLRPLTAVRLKLWAESVLRGGWVAVSSQELRVRVFSLYAHSYGSWVHSLIESLHHRH